VRNVVLEIDDVIVPQSLLEMARGGHGAARDAIAARVNDVVLYMHIATCQDDDAVVSLRELSKLGVVKSVRIGE
jgi:hypothetical protein